ncbi:hypothetical protein DJ66_0481 [Candidatus Liberibacter solanacearum]|uniref:Uncharacterized protein n=1 Tax=Candidatus Liberibacter solanacearum TaxID=556287 RepID=A0A0F4VJS8_9HYPH|nr:hypothetical protein DJ66_0481 [Candidatus Liberibacter solanacearum]
MFGSLLVLWNMPEAILNIDFLIALNLLIREIISSILGFWENG